MNKHNISRNSFDKDGYVVERYKDGSRSGEGRYIEGKKCGWWIAYHPNGTKASEGEYKNGLQEGVWCYWGDNGSLSAVAELINGLSHGRITYWTWNENEHKVSKIEEYNRGVLSSVYIIKNGLLEKEANGN